ncbi:DUF1778 domain-containing protein [Azospirillum sp. SYSU D00513]|uniref:type II toxin-antitoxin system TacA family antitoxin n=1 Tax=Azospirillum sp. SYSU D00513 TaxID=2812561 RepID=UPI001A975BAA|nr:DUF1778 domain-containing protein [Azospirillum sp. SYSU D00513]
MFSLPDPNRIAEERRSERLEQRIKPSVKRTIEIAAALTGTDTSDFVVTSAYEAALKRLAESRTTELAGEDAKRFFDALDRLEPKEPTDALRRAMAQYEDQVENAIR